MPADNLQMESVEWCIDTPHGKARYVGNPSTEILGDLFAMWLYNKENISDWDYAAMFGTIIVEYSDLSMPVVAVWLGINDHEIEQVTTPHSGPPWKFEGPDGEQVILDRNIG